MLSLLIANGIGFLSPFGSDLPLPGVSCSSTMTSAHSRWIQHSLPGFVPLLHFELYMGKTLSVRMNFFHPSVVAYQA